ncbi:MAG: hypothetical protein JWN28_618 [Candidatus Saccharibacteria bacterium]|nr:hypothetical protein [Candidatus Saccharibacteria bacterium]
MSYSVTEKFMIHKREQVISMSFFINVRPPKVGWIESGKRFFYNDEERSRFPFVARALATVLRTVFFVGGPITLLDDIGNAVPGLNIFTMGNDVVAAFTLFALIRICVIHHQANSLIEMKVLAADYRMLRNSL